MLLCKCSVLYQPTKPSTHACATAKARGSGLGKSLFPVDHFADGCVMQVKSYCNVLQRVAIFFMCCLNNLIPLQLFPS